MTSLVLLTHQPAAAVNRMVAAWTELTAPDQLVVAYGGPEAEFAGIHGDKAYIADPRLRTTDHQREKQSYTGMLKGAHAVIADRPWDYLYLAEFDMLPLAPDLWNRLETFAATENADLLGYKSWRIDNTLHPHFSHHLTNREWLSWLAKQSIREAPEVILSCMGCGQWWRRQALEAVLQVGEPVPAYLELHLPSLAHHLGFRIRGMASQEPFIQTRPLSAEEQTQFSADGAWITHPDKGLWTRHP